MLCWYVEYPPVPRSQRKPWTIRPPRPAWINRDAYAICDTQKRTTPSYAYHYAAPRQGCIFPTQLPVPFVSFWRSWLFDLEGSMHGWGVVRWTNWLTLFYTETLANVHEYSFFSFFCGVFFWKYGYSETILPTLYRWVKERYKQVSKMVSENFISLWEYAPISHEH